MKLWGVCLVGFFFVLFFFFLWILWPIINIPFSSQSLGCALMANQLLSGLQSEIQQYKEMAECDWCCPNPWLIMSLYFRNSSLEGFQCRINTPGAVILKPRLVTLCGSNGVKSRFSDLLGLSLGWWRLPLNVWVTSYLGGLEQRICDAFYGTEFQKWFQPFENSWQAAVCLSVCQEGMKNLCMQLFNKH